MSNNRRLISWLAFTISLVLANAVHAEFITTMPFYSGSGITPFGETDTATYGQTITVGADTFLTNYTFFVRTNSTAPSRFAGYVMQWDASLNHAVGPVLYDSGLMTNSGGYNTISVSPNINLTSGLKYVLFLSASNYFDGHSDSATWGSTAGTAYVGGDTVYFNNGNNFGLLSSSSWNVLSFLDMAFTANLAPAPVPVPAGIVMMTLGGGLLFARRRGLRKLRAS